MAKSSRWLILLLLAATACGGPFPQSTLAPKSDFAGQIDHLYRGIFWWAVAVFAIVEGVLLFVVILFRRRPGAPDPKGLHGHTGLELAWTVAPAMILIFIAVPTMKTIFATQREQPAGALTVEVVGHQWWWEYRYPSLGIVTANEMHLPVGRPIELQLSSADVIHSFWAPGLGGKRDVIPGHLNRIVFRPDSIGTFMGQCAEFCGASHANMRLRVMVESDSAFQAWSRDQTQAAAAPALPAPPAVPPTSLVAQGQQAFMRYGCVGCHTMGAMSNAKVGPVLTHLASRTTIAGGIFPNDSLHLAQWIGDPPRQKPGSIMPNMHVPPQDLAALIAFLQSMK